MVWSVASGAEIIAQVRVSSPDNDCFDVPLHAEIDLPERLVGVPLEKIEVKVTQFSDKFKTVSAPGQLAHNDKGQVEVWWVAPHLEANSKTTWTVGVPVPDRPNTDFGPVNAFSWRNKEAEYLDLLFDGSKVTRYMYAHETATAQSTFETYKPFHHVYDAGGNRLTNGPDGSNPYPKQGIRYPHHRGIFIGWNRLTFEEKRYDLWHMREVHQVHQKFLRLEAGPAMARSTALVHWNDEEEKPMIVEHRTTTVYRQSDPTIMLMDFHSELKAVRGDVYLNGDPEHAGVQYRAHNDVAAGDKENKAKYLFHKDGINPKKDYNLPWAAMSYGLDSGRYVVQHMNHPDNPKPTIYSAYRDYGRFGAFFKKEIPGGESLTVRYRIIVSKGDMPDRQALAERYTAYVESPKVEN